MVLFAACLRAALFFLKKKKAIGKLKKEISQIRWSEMSEKIETTTMSTRGQVIIPKKIRDHISASEGSIFIVMPLDKDTIVMKRIDKKKLADEFKGLMR